MDTVTEFAFDVVATEFEERVIRKSHELPVLVDFWASWCGPCQVLMPLLAKLAAAYQGKFLLAKVDTDAQQPLAQRFGIRSIPTVKLFRNGQVVEEFMGAQGERAIRTLLDRHVVRESDQAIPAARAALEAGRPKDALALLNSALATDPHSDRLMVERARALIATGQFDDAHETLQGLPPERRDQADIAGLLGQISLSRAVASAPTLAELEKRVSSDPQDHEARYQLGIRRVLNGEYDAGLAVLLEIVQRNRKFREDAARKTMLSVFTLLGSNHELARKYRALLARALY